MLLKLNQIRRQILWIPLPLFICLKETYHDAAEKFQPHGFFYSVSPEFAHKHTSFPMTPSITVYKEGEFYFFEGEFLIYFYW